MGTVWYISKYVILPGPGDPVGSRGFRLMAEMAREGHTVVVVTADSSHLTAVSRPVHGRYSVRSSEGLSVVLVKSLRVRKSRSWRRVLSWLDFEWGLLRMPDKDLPRPDVVIVSSLSLLTVVNGVRLKRRWGSSLVFEVRDIWPLTLTEVGGFSRWNPFVMGLGVIERWGYRAADVVVGTMPNLGEHVVEVGGGTTPVACIPMGVAEQQLAAGQPVDPGVLSQIPSGRFLVTYAGTVGLNNALHTLMECAVQADAEGEGDLHFLVVGDGGLKQHYEQRYGYLPNLTFLPRVAKEQVATILGLSDLLYFSTHESKVWKYGQSLNKLIDYMAAGKPIVASYTGYPSMIDEAECGSFVPAADASAALREICRYRDMAPEVRRQIGARGRTWLIRNRQYSRLAGQYAAVIDLPAVDSALGVSGGSCDD